MVAPRGARAAFWTIRTTVLAVIGVVLVLIGLSLDGGDRIGVVALGVFSLVVCVAVVVLWRRDKL